MSDDSDSAVRLFSYEDDRPNERKGLLIPGRIKDTRTLPPATTDFTPAAIGGKGGVGYKRNTTALLALFALTILGTSAFGLWSLGGSPAVPVVTINAPYSNRPTTLEYGPLAALASNNFFIETRDAFIEESLTFIELDLSQSQLRYFENGVLLQSAEILGTPDSGSWSEVSSGLYQVEQLDEEIFSTVSQVDLPWRVTFQNNYYIHGLPTYPNGEEVDEDFNGGGVRLADAAAERLFANVKEGVPVLVHKQVAAKDTFIYEPKVPEVGSNHYFIGDIDNGSVLAASDLNAVAPIASVTKLMTALVAAEEIDLDQRVRVTAPTFVNSLIPRLADRSSVSMYSLLQLLLLESSNEAAETIAGEMGREDFIAAMNAKARQIGMLNTTFVDPAGLQDGNESTIGDLYQLAKYIHDNKKFIFDLTVNEKLTSVYVGGEFDGLINFNELEDMDSFVGGKVGETTAAGQTSVSLHEIEFQGEVRKVIIIVLGSTDRTTDIETLISHAKSQFDS